MPPRPLILASAQAEFPPSANKTVRIPHAWKPSGGELRPAPNGPDGWDVVSEFATRQVVERLRDQGYTWVNLEAGGTANPRKDVPISRLI